MITFTLHYAPQGEGLPLEIIQANLTADKMIVELERMVESSGFDVLDGYLVTLGGSKSGIRPWWSAVEWWAMQKMPAPGATLLKRVSGDVVVSELIRDQMDHHKAMSETARLASSGHREAIRHAILIIESLGFVIARKEEPEL